MWIFIISPPAQQTLLGRSLELLTQHARHTREEKRIVLIFSPLACLTRCAILQRAPQWRRLIYHLLCYPSCGHARLRFRSSRIVVNEFRKCCRCPSLLGHRRVPEKQKWRIVGVGICGNHRWLKAKKQWPNQPRSRDLGTRLWPNPSTNRGHSWDREQFFPIRTALGRKRVYFFVQDCSERA